MFLLKRPRKIVLGDKGTYEHTFGGECANDCAIDQLDKKPLKLILRLDTKDNLVTRDNEEIQLIAFPCRFLPIYLAPRTSSEIQYLVDGSGKLTVLHQSNDFVELDFPLGRVQCEPFNLRSVTLQVLPYEEVKTLGWVALARSYALEVSSEDRRKAEELGYPFHQWGSYFEILNRMQPAHTCLNKACENFEALMRPVGTLYNKISDSEYLISDKPRYNQKFQIIIEICRSCCSLQVSIRGKGYVGILPQEMMP